MIVTQLWHVNKDISNFVLKISSLYSFCMLDLNKLQEYKKKGKSITMATLSVSEVMLKLALIYYWYTFLWKRIWKCLTKSRMLLFFHLAITLLGITTVKQTQNDVMHKDTYWSIFRSDNRLETRLVFINWWLVE